MSVFLMSYLFVGAAVALGWFLVPAVTVLVFFLLSAWHFGLEEEPDSLRAPWQHLAAVAQGGMIIWVPALFRPDEMNSLLARVIPTSADVENTLMPIVRTVAPGLACVLLIHVATTLHYRRWESVRIACTAAMCAVAPLLVSFTVYFCGWHSLRALVTLRHEHFGAWRSFILQLLPLTLATLLLGVATAWYWSGVEEIPTALVRTTFIGLSAIAVPHLIMHILTDFPDLAFLRRPVAG